MIAFTNGILAQKVGLTVACFQLLVFHLNDIASNLIFNCQLSRLLIVDMSY